MGFFQIHPKLTLHGLVISILFSLCSIPGAMARGIIMETVKLPVPNTENGLTLNQALAQRRSRRQLGESSLPLKQVGQLLWAAQGITDARGLRTAPSGGALYPLELYLVAGKVENLTPGIYRYLPEQHALELQAKGEHRSALAKAALNQEYIRENSVLFVFTAVYERTTKKYGRRGIRYVHIEVGHAAENLLLTATSLGLDAVMVGAFNDDEIRRLMALPSEEHPLALIPIGKP